MCVSEQITCRTGSELSFRKGFAKKALKAQTLGGVHKVHKVHSVHSKHYQCPVAKGPNGPVFRELPHDDSLPSLDEDVGLSSQMHLHMECDEIESEPTHYHIVDDRRSHHACHKLAQGIQWDCDILPSLMYPYMKYV
jgi:hypothetical protein